MKGSAMDHKLHRLFVVVLSPSPVSVLRLETLYLDPARATL
jgi:hypothetical protein